MQPGEDDLDDRHALVGVQAHGNAPAVVSNLDAAILEEARCRLASLTLPQFGP